MAIDSIPKSSILVGPLLGIEQGGWYTFCILAQKKFDQISLELSGSAHACTLVTQTPSGTFWRCAVHLPSDRNARQYSYKFVSGGNPLNDRSGTTEWTFTRPDETALNGFAYASCNGFSSADKAKNSEDPYVLWEKMLAMHGEKPFSLLLMGGDQLYADQIWERSGVPELYTWSHLSKAKKAKFPFTNKIRGKVEAFYERLYITHWNDFSMRTMLASVPSVMMWDDHDIFDGWGSYPPELQEESIVYKEVFAIAKKYFELFQLRTRDNRNLINARNPAHSSLGLQFGEYAIVVLDNRSERSLTQIMSHGHWTEVKNWLSSIDSCKTLLVLTAVPAIYRSFAAVELFTGATPWQEELEDDINDHWSAKRHQGERMKLFMNLFEQTKRLGCTTVLVSGDVHVGSWDGSQPGSRS